MAKLFTSASRTGVAQFALCLSMISAPAFAQQAPATTAAAAADDTNRGEEIVVTGSRIARPELQASIPVTVVSAQSIQDKGQTNLLDSLRDVPLSGQSLGNAGSNFSNFDNGTATVNLRNLGESRTLVLINGRRSIGIPGDTAVDLNNIPTDLIDHVEIATGGTSAVYGSDAVAGVVNIILKKRFDGVQLHLQNMLSDKGDAVNQMASITAGKTFADGAGHLIANFTYSNDKGLRSSDRDFSRNDSPNKSSYAQQGLFDTSGTAEYSVADGQVYTFTPDNTVKSYQGGAIDGYNRAQNRLLSVPVKRYIASALGDYEFSSAATAYFEFTYSKTKARASIEPLAVDDQGVQGQSVYNFDGSPYLGIPVTNPYLPAQIANAAIANGQSFVNFRRRSNGIFDRSPVSDRDFFRGVIGVKGDLGSSWRYDLSYEHSQMRDDTLSQNILMNNYGAALNAISLGGQIVCADPVARAAGCVPINIFGYNTVSPAAVKFLSTYTGQGVVIPGATVGQTVVNDLLRKNYQDVATLNVAGSLFNLPAGPVQVALGAEYHREKSVQIYDPFTASGLSGAQQATNTVGTHHSKEAFAEISIPVLKESSLGYDLSLEGAARYADYSTVGGVWSYKFGANYAPIRDIRFRAIYARAVRAPNINELDANQNTTAPQVIDPCDQNEGNGDIPVGGSPSLATLPAGCAAIPGISTYLQTHPYFAYSLAQVQTVSGFLGGNPNLDAEATNTLTAGFVLTPSFLRGFDLSVDYYRIKVKNAIALVDQQTSVDECFNLGLPQFCNNVVRNSNGFITTVNSTYINAASYLVAGLDVQAHYNFRPRIFNPDERVNLGVFYNHKFKQEQLPFVGGPVSNELGTADIYAGNQLGTGFKDQFTFNASYSTGPFSLAYTLKYYGPVTASGGDIKIPSFMYHDVQAKFAVGDDKRFEFYVGVNNLFDKKPPFIASGDSQFPGTNTVADTYDVYGRMLYVGVTSKF
ncbi:MAG: TonB-dependent receptor [Novosphingobium sp.]